MNLIVFEDAGTSDLFPITISRPAYAITCASFRLIDWLNEFDGNLVGLVRPHLETIQLHDFPEFQQQLDPNLKWTMVVNARLAPSHSNIRRLQQLMQTPRPDASSTQVIRSGWAIAAALVLTDSFADQPKDLWLKIIEEFANCPDADLADHGLELFDYPHTVVAQNLTCFDENIAHRIVVNQYHEHQKNVYLGRDVRIDSTVVFDASIGPIVIDDGVQIGPFSFVRGPAYIGPRSRVSEHASIKDFVSIAHTCKIGGEVEGTIIEPYTNKQHHGFLGHSYVGSWINLGAGTCNSDLKNTYGTVNMQYGDKKISTGMQFVGCIIGDYAKTAINTSIFTGKTIGVASMVYGFATTNVPSFVNYARTFDAVGHLPAEVIVTTQKRMFSRRQVTQRPCDIQLVYDMHRITASQRPSGLSSESISL